MFSPVVSEFLSSQGGAQLTPTAACNPLRTVFTVPLLPGIPADRQSELRDLALDPVLSTVAPHIVCLASWPASLIPEGSNYLSAPDLAQVRRPAGTKLVAVLSLPERSRALAAGWPDLESSASMRPLGGRGTANCCASVSSVKWVWHEMMWGQQFSMVLQLKVPIFFPWKEIYIKAGSASRHGKAMPGVISINRMRSWDSTNAGFLQSSQRQLPLMKAILWSSPPAPCKPMSDVRVSVQMCERVCMCVMPTKTLQHVWCGSQEITWGIPDLNWI